MNLKVKRGFRDKEARLDRFAGQEFKATAERGAQLIKLNLVEEVKAETKKEAASDTRTTKEEKAAKKTK